MKPERINQVIAEHCGVERGIDNQWRVDGIWYSRPPDYSSDLNAIHAALTTLDLPSHVLYRKVLKRIITRHSDPSCMMSSEQYRLFHDATAAQRAEAFVRAINKWEEE